jgi:hypothetical protein
MDENSRAVRVTLAQTGQQVLVETVVVGEQRAAALPKEFSFDSIGTTIESLAKELQQTFDRVKPDKSSVKFGIEVAIEAGQLTALIVKGSGKANLEVTLEWGKTQPTTSGITAAPSPETPSK